MYGVKLTDKLQSTELREIVTILQRNRLQWYGHLLHKDDSERAKKCTDYEADL